MESQLDNLYPVKKGKLAKDKDENFMLLNSEGKAYSTNSAILLIWELCSGESSVTQLCNELRANSKNNSVDLTEKVSEIIEKLNKAKLVEFKRLEH
ncbi:hypothetical protein BMS_0908 [Halobacteriovorax marinus SJ]|uniref:PqqD family protein n=1 Tax=Halobacteriovorax marinus (strain ATCC BAA-682 / DSM 15412 / SJ) TaxID=862908 RepID=E1WX98_HALMS|nr:PqqD family protein [Halobacteriovorax marinus]CBW25799.1 hypothetical protein BMS_0908 [Halobacteriovorax marinus SJ]